MTQTTKARQRLNALAAQQEALLTQIEGQATVRQRVWKSDPKIWSLAQVVQHVGLSARELLKTERQAKKPGSKVKFWVMRRVLKAPVRLKLPPGVPIGPEAEVTWEEAVSTARGALQKWSAHLETAGDDMVFMHPFAGPLTLEQTLIFLQDHFEHHVPQVERLLNKLPA